LCMSNCLLSGYLFRESYISDVVDISVEAIDILIPPLAFRVERVQD
jgi:hypothetical protein